MEPETGGSIMTIDWTGVTLPFTAGDVLTSSMGLIGVVAGLIVLALVFPLAGKFVAMIKSALASRSKA
jgi:hypothetical protein